METRAPYALIGMFVLAAIAAVFGFVYWLNHGGGLGERTVYFVRFEGPVSGLQTGSAVLFNGIRVGEVTELRLDPKQPRQVIAKISVDPATPLRADSQVGIDFQGIAGAPVISLNGGMPDAAELSAAPNERPTLVADPAAIISMTQGARTVLRRLDAILGDNSEQFRNLISNLNTFSDALARNSSRVDGIIAGLERMTGGGATAAPATIYDLTAPQTFPGLSKPSQAQLAVPEPTTVILFDTQKILVRPMSDNPAFATSQWSDSLPKLVQARIIQSFENANYPRAVGRPMDGFSSDFQLLIDIRGFHVAGPEPATADVELGAKILANDGKIVDSRVFHARAPAGAADPSAAAKAIDEAFDKVATDLVAWVANQI